MVNSKLSALVILLTIAAIEIGYLLKTPLVYGFPGSIDFIQYWSAYQLFSQGKNPYDPKLMLEIENLLNYKDSLPIMMWLPPWALIVFTPFMLAGFKAGFLSFLIFNLVLLLLSSYLLQRAFSTERKFQLSTCLLALLFFPAWDCINFGQISIILLFALSSAIFLVIHNQLFLAGLFVAILSFKPHLFILLGITSIFWTIKKRKYLFAASTILSLFALVFITDLKHGDALQFWLMALRNNEAIGRIKTSEWAPATIGTWLRLIFGIEKTYLMWLPTLAGLPLLVFVYSKKRSSSFAKNIALTTALSVMLSPYAWFYDQSLLLVCQIYLFYSGGLKKMIALQFGYFILKLIPGVHQEHFVIMLPLWLLACYSSSTSGSMGSSSNSSELSSGENCSLI